jgi:hypothetical protein
MSGARRISKRAGIARCASLLEQRGLQRDGGGDGAIYAEVDAARGRLEE